MRSLSGWMILGVACFGLASLALVSSVYADEPKGEKKPAYSGRWARETEGIELMFDFKTKDQLVLSAEVSGARVKITCSYTVDEKTKKIAADVTKVEEEGEFPAKPPKGYKFKFLFKIDQDKAELTEYEADNAEEVKPIIEGTYSRKKAD